MDKITIAMKRGRIGYVESAEERLAYVQAFIQGLKFSKPLCSLRAVNDRRECPKCKKRRQFYCYDCLTVLHPESHPPPLALPLNVYVVLHPDELRGKSTSLAASTISPDMHIVEYPQVPEHLEPAKTLVLYPSAESVSLNEIESLESYDNVVFVDSTWQQSKGIARDERVAKFKHVRIRSQTSLFWRFQNNDPTYLATVEAIYYFLREYTTQVNRRKALVTNTGSSSGAGTASATVEGDEATYYHGEVDDLLYYYINQYIAIQQRYTQGSLHTYTDRHFEGYILTGADWGSLVAPPSGGPEKT